MENITQTTENRINAMLKSGNKYGKSMRYLLDTYKGRASWLGATIKEMKMYGELLDNNFQFDIYEDYALNGLSVNYPHLINTVNCLDLNYVTVYDFNKLVKIVSEI